MEFKDYYAALGVAREASEPEIKKAYRRLVRKHHPDVNPSPDSKQRMQELNEAWEVLRDPERRAAYDRIGARRGNGPDLGVPPDNWDAGFEFDAPQGAFHESAHGHSDFFEALFGSLRSRAPRTGEAEPSRARRGQDHHATIMVPLEDSFSGAERKLSLERPEFDEQGRMQLRMHEVLVRIPIGIRPGQQIRLAGQGGPGASGAPAGDLFLEVQFQPHARYRVEDRDLYITLPLAPWEAVLGATLPVRTPGGIVELQIPPNSQAGRSLRLRGRGLPALGSGSAGDLYAVLTVVLPPANTPAAQAAYRRMATELAFDPRAGQEV
ncbi:MAG: DnaJ domain-containing protein [Paucibacter sp.]|nr:DnaJ domain-containing protein [Roseateles sp.]